MKSILLDQEGHCLLVCMVAASGSLVLICQRCGGFASSAPRKLAEPCTGTRLGNSLCYLRRVWRGVHPKQPQVRLDAVVPLTEVIAGEAHFFPRPPTIEEQALVPTFEDSELMVELFSPWLDDAVQQSSPIGSPRGQVHQVARADLDEDGASFDDMIGLEQLFNEDEELHDSSWWEEELGSTIDAPWHAVAAEAVPPPPLPHPQAVRPRRQAIIVGAGASIDCSSGSCASCPCDGEHGLSAAALRLLAVRERVGAKECSQPFGPRGT